jgi:hypothetical protein
MERARPSATPVARCTSKEVRATQRRDGRCSAAVALQRACNG